MTTERNDPYKAFHFVLTIDGLDVAGFSECSGIPSETDVIEYRTDDEDIRVRKIPGLRKLTKITLKRGIVALQLLKWHETVAAGTIERRDGSISLLNEAGEPVIRWAFLGGWPSKWEGPSLDAKDDETAVETLEITVEGLRLQEAAQAR